MKFRAQNEEKKKKDKKTKYKYELKNKGTLYSGQFTLLTQSIKPNYHGIPLH